MSKLIRDLGTTNKCRFVVVIEGCDMLGKATQSQLLAKRLSYRRGYSDVGLLEVPIRDKLSYPRIYEMLADGRAKKYPSTFQALHILNRILYQESSLKNEVDKYDALVFDRWNASSYAYGRAAGIEHDELMCELDLVATADLTIILEGKPFHKDNLDTYEADAPFQVAVRSAYYEWAKTQKRTGSVYVVDANDTIDAVHQAIWSICSDYIENNIGADDEDANNVIDLHPYLDAKRYAETLKKET